MSVFTLPYPFITILSSPNILSVLFSPLLSTILQNLFHLPLKMNLHFHHILFHRLKTPTAKPGFTTALELLNVSSVSTWTHWVWSIIHGVSALRPERSTADFRGLTVPCKDFLRKMLEDYQYLMICPGFFILCTVAFSQKMQCSKSYLQSNSLAWEEGTSQQTQKLS